MGLIKAAAGAIGGMFADQWLETIQPGEMDDKTVFVRGVKTRNDKRSSNTKATDQTISNGSIIQVYDNQCMILTDGGKIVDFTTEPGAFKVDNSSSPSLFAGQFGDVLKDTFERFKFGGTPSGSQRVYYINLQEIKGIKFGTKSPISYFDNFYNAELFLRTFGSYSIKITDPLLFYGQAIPKNADRVTIEDINEQYLAEFLSALQSAINRFSMEGVRVSHVPSKSMELSKYMAEVLDDDWKKLRGMEVLSVGIQSVSYDEESQKLINVRNQGAMLSDPTIREGYVQGSIARGMEAAGSNAAGAMTGFAGIGMGMNSAGGFMSAASQSNTAQMQAQANAMQQQAQAQQANNANAWTCSCGEKNTGKFCGKCGSPKPQNETWTCSCGATNTGKFCSECGSPKPQVGPWTCSCGATNTGKFCSECGKPRQ
ncbi:MAG: SPFH domain-containing protein [Treponemataceae bacterium]|nr:SPFH domain-containing protein [Treponemataceae bacterium]